MRIAGVREFREIAPEAMKRDEIVIVTRHGKLVGVLIPMSDPKELPDDLRREFIVKVGDAIAEHLKGRGVTEEKIQRDFEAWRKARRAPRRRR